MICSGTRDSNWVTLSPKNAPKCHEIDSCLNGDQVPTDHDAGADLGLCGPRLGYWVRGAIAGAGSGREVAPRQPLHGGSGPRLTLVLRGRSLVDEIKLEAQSGGLLGEAAASGPDELNALIGKYAVGSWKNCESTRPLRAAAKPKCMQLAV